jgi:DNA replication protein DnaC
MSTQASGRQLTKPSRIDILVLDDFAMAPLKDGERCDFLELCDDRYQRRSLALTSQLQLPHWHEQIPRSPTTFLTGWPITLTASNLMRIHAQDTRGKPEEES